MTAVLILVGIGSNRGDRIAIVRASTQRCARSQLAFSRVVIVADEPCRLSARVRRFHQRRGCVRAVTG
jgi:hypothetical protein